MPSLPQSKSQGEGGEQQQAAPPRIRPERGVWLPFGLFVLGFLILVADSKYTLPLAADYALKGLGAALCLVTLVWTRRQARKSRIAKRINNHEQP